MAEDNRVVELDIDAVKFESQAAVPKIYRSNSDPAYETTLPPIETPRGLSRRQALELLTNGCCGD